MRVGQTTSSAPDQDLDSVVSPEMTGLEASAPASVPIGAAAASQTLYLQEPGDTAPISIDDIHQGMLGDCFLLSVIGELALTHPSTISNMIHLNPDGTETVTIYGAHSATTPFLLQSRYDPHSVTITNLFPANAVNSGATQDAVGNQKEIWPQVLEKAVAMFSGGYATINYGGLPAVAMAELTGHAPLRFSAGSVSADMLASFSAAHDLIVFDTPISAKLPGNLVSNHAYMFEGLVGTGAAASVQLGNPWGYDQPALIPVSQLGRAFSEIDIGRVA